jgi:hypothetical protein
MRFGFEADFWIAPLLRFYNKYQTNELLKFVYLLDAKFSSDWIIGFSPTKRNENVNAIINEIETATDKNALFLSPSFKVEVQDLIRILSGGIYGRRFCRYILLKIDLAYHGHTTKFSPPGTISIEHILPQTPDAASQWISDFSEQEREKWTNRLGNLILLSRRKNSAQSNLDYQEKKEKYFKNNLELFSNSIRIFNTFSNWKLDDLKKNHKETLVKFLSAYSITMFDNDLKTALE